MSILTPEELDHMAPPLEEYHRAYAMLMQQIFWQLHELIDHPGTDQSEDLGDWIETLSTLISFRPRTHPKIEAAVKEEFEAALDD